jgi:HEAT repeat protein
VSLVVRSFALATALLASSGASAEQRPSPQAARSLRARLGIEATRTWFRAEKSELRQRAFERLGSTGTAAAFGLLAHALEPDGEARDAKERLVVVRALAAKASEETARSALVRAMAGIDGHDEPKDALVRDTAALALAKSQNPRAIELLAQALRQSGRTAQTAKAALLAHPPRDLTPLFAARGAPTEVLVELLGSLGDPRAAPLLEKIAEAGTPALRPKALHALSRLDAERAATLARAFAGEQDRALRLVCARLLALSEAAEAPALLAALLRDPLTRSEALAIALEARGTALGTALAAASVSDHDITAWLGALGRSTSRAGIPQLEVWLKRPQARPAAAYALALSPRSEAGDALERALKVAELRRDAARAATLRMLASERSTEGLEAALDALARSSTPADRAAAAFCRAALDPERGAELVASADPLIVRAAARAALDPGIALAAADRLARERDPLLRASLALSLAVSEAADRVPDTVLTELLESRGAAAHLAARALATRDSEILRPRLRELLASTDPTLRAHVALGLASSGRASAVGLLADTYRFEVDPRVRRAVVAALAARKESGRRRTLTLAADLDPDPETRRMARLALAATHDANESSSAAPRATAWLVLPPRIPGDDSLLVLETASGLALPLSLDPDGAVVAARLPPGDVTARLSTASPGPPER